MLSPGEHLTKYDQKSHCRKSNGFFVFNLPPFALEVNGAEKSRLDYIEKKKRVLTLNIGK
nr:hypothetical protein [Mucilaginibacter sp. FT3.2]